MHPDVSAFSARHFYDGRLKDGVEGDPTPPPGFPWPAPGRPVALVASDRWREDERAGGSPCNQLEAAGALRVAEGVTVIPEVLSSTPTLQY